MRVLSPFGHRRRIADQKGAGGGGKGTFIDTEVSPAWNGRASRKVNPDTGVTSAKPLNASRFTRPSTENGNAQEGR
jgi:hypothetical protein